MEPNKKKIRVVGAAIIDSGKVLVAQRPVSDKAYKSLKWEFPGGKVEDGETEEVFKKIFRHKRLKRRQADIKKDTHFERLSDIW